MYIQTEYIWYTTPKCMYWFRAFWDDFPKNIPLETWTHPPTSIVIADFWKCYSLHSPLCSAVSSRLDRSRRFLLHRWQMSSSHHQYDLSGKIQPRYNYCAKTIYSHISTIVCSRELAIGACAAASQLRITISH